MGLVQNFCTASEAKQGMRKKDKLAISELPWSQLGSQGSDITPTLRVERQILFPLIMISKTPFSGGVQFWFCFYGFSGCLVGLLDFVMEIEDLLHITQQVRRPNSINKACITKKDSLAGYHSLFLAEAGLPKE